MVTLPKIKKESIDNHLMLLDILLRRNRFWTIGENNSEVLRIHNEIIDLIKQIGGKYMELTNLGRKDGM